MRRYLFILLFTVIFSFMWGVWWGFKPPKEAFNWVDGKVSLRVLAPKNILKPEFVKILAQEENIHLQVDEMDSGIELLRELLSHKGSYDLILFSSFLSDSIILDHYFSELEVEPSFLDRQVSVDFLQLKFDPDNKYSLPLLWGVNGWLVPKTEDKQEFSIKDHDQLKMLNEPAELFGLATKLKPIIRSWVETGASKQLLENKSFLSRFNFKQGVRQISSGSIQPNDLEDNVFRLAKERSHLWIMHAAVTKESSKKDSANEALKLMLSSKWSEKLANMASAATVNKRLDASDQLPAYRKASYIRRLPISQIELFSSHEAYEPIFMSILQKLYPSVFN